MSVGYDPFYEAQIDILQNRIQKLNAVAQAALVLLSPPNHYQSHILRDKRELQEWNQLRNSLSEAGYDWVEYT